MQIHLDSFGASLRVKDGMFWVKPRLHAGKCFAPVHVRSITITKGVHLSSDALLLAIAHHVPVLIVNAIGHLEGMLWQGQYGSTAAIRKGQLAYAQDAAGLTWCIKGIAQKLHGQQVWLTRIGKQLPSLAPDAPTGTDEVLQRTANQLDVQRNRLIALYQHSRPTLADEETIRGIEGAAARSYFQALAMTLPEAFRFERRSRRPAIDPFSALLNYGYGMLYAQVYVALIKAGLDPHIGVLHADGHKRPALVYDMIEPYRVWVERVAWELCRSGRLSVQDFEERGGLNGLWLATSGKRATVQALEAYLNAHTPYQNRQVKRLTAIDLAAQQLAQQCKLFIHN